MEIRVPSLGESVMEATVAQWFKSVGDVVSADTPLVELETDKVTLEVNAGASGRLSEIVAPEGANVEVGGLLGRIEEGAPAAEEAEKPPSKAERAPPQAAQTPAEAAPRPAEPEAPLALSPAVRKLVEEHHLEPKAIPGTGKGGRILKGDVLAWVERHERAEAPEAPAPGEAEPAAAPTPTAETATAEAPAPEALRPSEPRPEARREQRVRMTRLRKRIAERLKEAQETAAMLTTFNEADLSKVIELRRAFRERFEARHGVKLGFMSFFVKAAVTALKEIPEVNAEIEGDEIVYKSYYHIGVAVSAPQGLIVPVIRDAERLSFAEIEKTIAELSQKASEGTLSMADLSGGTFTISNGGIFGSLLSTPIINPPQAAILGMHKIEERPVALDGEIEIRPMMYLALTYDHRLVDGREAVTFLVRIKECIEDPQRMLLDL